MEEIVLQIRPSIENFLKSPDRRNLQILQEHLRSTNSDKLDSFQNYILIPLVVQIGYLEKGKYNELQVELIETVHDLIKRIHIKNINALKTIIVIILQQIHNFETGKLKDLSEELKLAVIETIAETFQRSTFEVVEKFYQHENVPLIGKIAVTCVDLIEKEKYRKLRIACIKCLQALFYVHDTADHDDIVLRNQVADTVFMYLPKIVTVLIDVAIGDEKNGSALISISTQTLGNILNIIFEDDVKIEQKLSYDQHDFVNLIKNKTAISPSAIKDNEILYTNIKSNNSEENFKKLQNNGRCSVWIGASSRKLIPILTKMTILRANISSNVRFEYAKMACNLAIKCTRNLNENFIIFLETIIALSQDQENANIQNLCRNSIEILNNMKLDNDFNVMLEKLFDLHITKLPRIIYRSEESEQYSEFLFLKGFFSIVPNDNIRILLSVRDNLEKLIKCLIVAYELKLTKDLLQEEYALRIVDEDHNDFNIFAWREFKHLSSNRVQSILNDICKILGSTSVVDVIFDLLMELLRKNSQIYNECIMVLMLLLTGENDSKQHENYKLLQNYLDEILEENHWHLELQPDQSQALQIKKNSDWYVDRTPGLYESAIEIRKSDINMEDDEDKIVDNFVKISDAQYNVLHTCLLLDAIGHVALTMKEHFKPFVFKSLHKVLLKTGSSNYLVHKSGSFALNCITRALKFTRIAELIQNYSDYISYHINIFLKKSYNSESDSAVDILTVVLRYSSINTMSHLENIIETILNELTKSSQYSSNILTSYLKVFDVFLLNVTKWSQEKHIEIEINCVEQYNNCIKLKTNLYNKCIEVLNRPSNEINLCSNTTNENSNKIENIDDETNYEIHPNNEQSNTDLPNHIKIVIKILKNVLKFIASKDQMQKVISLECFIHGLPILIDYENELLPLVHLVWHPYIERFKDNDPIVLYRCFILLDILAKCAKDFLLQKTLNDIVPLLNKFLRNSSVNSLGHSNVIQTQEFKLQTKLLREYGELITNIDIKHKPLDDITDVIILYIHKNQPKILQEAAIQYFTIISSFNRPLIYIKLLYYLNHLEYKENVNKIYKSIGIKTK